MEGRPGRRAALTLRQGRRRAAGRASSASAPTWRFRGESRRAACPESCSASGGRSDIPTPGVPRARRGFRTGGRRGKGGGQKAERWGGRGGGRWMRRGLGAPNESLRFAQGLPPRPPVGRRASVAPDSSFVFYAFQSGDSRIGSTIQTTETVCG